MKTIGWQPWPEDWTYELVASVDFWWSDIHAVRDADGRMWTIDEKREVRLPRFYINNDE